MSSIHSVRQMRLTLPVVQPPLPIPHRRRLGGNGNSKNFISSSAKTFQFSPCDSSSQGQRPLPTAPQHQQWRHASLAPFGLDDEEDVDPSSMSKQSKRNPKNTPGTTYADPSFTSSSSSSSSLPCPIYVAATRQHVGKTSTSVALMSGLQKRFPRVGFIKPVGQHFLTIPDPHYDTTSGEDCRYINVDKDAVLVKRHFGLDHVQYEHASPVLIPKGYTKQYLNGMISPQEHKKRIQTAYRTIQENSDIVLCEGTGHCAVGSIIHASNAQVASWLGAKMVLVANGGVGKTFDELSLNKVLCDQQNVPVAGVIVNRVQPDKVEQTREYIQKALDMYWGSVPLLGCIPDRPFLGCPTLGDLESLFGTRLMTGKKHRLRHYQVQDLNLVATSLKVFLKTLQDSSNISTKIASNNNSNPPFSQEAKIFICHASRDDILKAFLLENPHSYQDNMDVGSGFGGICQAALVVTGTHEHPVNPNILDLMETINKENPDGNAPPVLLAPYPTHTVMDMIHRFTPKLNSEDAHRANKAIEYYEPYIDFDLLLERVGYDAKSKEMHAAGHVTH